MSKAPAKAEAAEGEAPAKGGKKKLIIIIVAVLILAIAGGAAFMLMGKKKHADGEEAEEDVSHEPPKIKVDPSKPPVVRWRSAGQLLYTNWLNYYVYQTTPYDLKQI